MAVRGAPDPDPDPDPAGYPVNLVDPAGSNISGSGSDPDLADLRY